MENNKSYTTINMGYGYIAIPTEHLSTFLNIIQNSYKIKREYKSPRGYEYRAKPAREFLDLERFVQLMGVLTEPGLKLALMAWREEDN